MGDAEQRVARAGAEAEEAVGRAEDRAETAIHRAADEAKERIHQAETRVKDTISSTEARVRGKVAEAQRTFGEIRGLSDPTPAGSVDEAVQQASDLRRAIDRDLDALQSRLPPGDELQDKAKTIGGAVLGVAAAAAAIAIGSKQRGERKRLEREAKAHAAAIARYLPGASTEPIVEPSGKAGKALLALIALVGAGVAALAVARARGGGDQEPDVWGPAD